MTMLVVFQCIFLFTLHHILVFSSYTFGINGAQRKLDQTQKTNFCESHDKVEMGNIHLRNALRNLSISIGVKEFRWNEKDIGVKTLDKLAERANLTWRDRVSIVDPPSESQTWNKVLKCTASYYDLALGLWLRTLDGLVIGLGFTQEFYDSSITMIQVKKGKNTNSTMNLNAIAQPFFRKFGY